MREPPWRHGGEDPDCRVTLANERTSLDWSRTAVAVMLQACQGRAPHPNGLPWMAALVLLACATGGAGILVRLLH
jgi:putative membrane protein